MSEANAWIERLGLEPHPEGGFFKESHRGEMVIPPTALPAAFDGARSVCTAIYYLLRSEDRSCFHRLHSDEVWHHYDGAPVIIHVLSPEGYVTVRLGVGPRETPQTVIPAGRWFGATVEHPHSFALVGCTVSPGFDFRDFELASRRALLAQYPGHREIIERLTAEDA